MQRIQLPLAARRIHALLFAQWGLNLIVKREIYSALTAENASIRVDLEDSNFPDSKLIGPMDKNWKDN